jgi:hypothetical protein
MATVVSWLPQLAGPDFAWAGWPGSNGSVTGTNATAVDGAPLAVALAVALAAALGVPFAVPDALEPLLQPASKPTAAAHTAASASLP